MKNQLCKPCDYRRAFRLRFNFQRNPGFITLGMYEYGRLLQSFKRHWPVKPPRFKPYQLVEFDICWRYRCPLFPEQVGYFKIAPLLALLKRAAIKAYGDFYWNNLFANLNGCGPLMANSSKLWERPDK